MTVPPTNDRSESASVTVVVIAALSLETAPLLRQLDVRKSVNGNGFKFRNCFLDSTRVIVVEGGAGRERARGATNAAIDAFSPDWVLSVGLSGGLRESMKTGHIVVANEVVDSNGPQEIRIPIEMEDSPGEGLHVGRVCTVDRIVRTVEQKKQLRNATEAIAADMESLAVASTCRERQVPFMVIRSISDALDADLPSEVLAIFGNKGTIRAGALVGSLFKRPECVKDLWQIREQATSAAKSLATFLLGVFPQLTRSPKPDHSES
ncbi:5'-methylthioadenosine/S-adenosylhomocysteine nucleosidase [Thalassoglobus neptunius]|uniref:5'-methylthioadenosine/S-adenosylhomocysteine nucleosidase n=1 Tax=Thalassoglobus neptunius TaxID=1938619 RepID=A0A5C5X8P9_9PLAN|nr:5'-methylthioadenosine nucleosidase [Thalassoglobus neptunius]TWT58525.1 5'-methylthioadenosine/S-adenosylhomocysteine nucleosidase [Thalassoglobus neptunius]